MLDTGQVENLSIRGRDPMSLLKILPGVQLLANDNETVGGSFNSPVPSLQGGSGQTVYVDGINGGDGGGGGSLSGTTVIDAIAEVNVQMSAYTAEYGLKGGSQINVITKHGGAEYHGTGYWYKRHEAWNSINYFNKINNRPKPQYRYSNLGGTIGGPIPSIKGINPDGNKLFFFYVIDDTQLKNVQSLKFYQMPTALERAGDFSQSVTPNGALIVVSDPRTERTVPGQPDSGESPGSARSGVPEPVSDAEHDRRQWLQLRHAGAQHSASSPAAHVPRRLSPDRARLARGEVSDLLHQAGRHQRRRRLGTVGSRETALRLLRRHRQGRLHAHSELVDDPRVLDRLLQQRRGRTSRGRHGAARHSAQHVSTAEHGWVSSRGSNNPLGLIPERGVRQHSERRPERRATTAARRR